MGKTKILIFVILLLMIIIPLSLADSPKEIIKLKINDKTAYINGEAVTLDVAPTILPPGRTMVPIRFIAESFGANVNWDPSNREITITVDSIEFLKNEIRKLKEELKKLEKDETPPEILIFEPKEKITTEPEVIIKGKAYDNNRIKKLFINKEFVDFDEGGKFELKVSLTPGENQILIIATDVSGNMKIKTLTITYNRPPERPHSPFPENGSEGTDTKLTISWECKDPDNESLTYDIYFGDSQNPPLIVSNYNKNHYDLENLKFETTYYWYIVAKDERGGTVKSPIWSFTTKSPYSIEKYYIPGANIRQVIRREDEIYAATDDGEVYRLNIKDKTWERVFKAPSYTKRLNVYDDALYILCGDNKIYNVDTGEKVYEVPQLDEYGCYDFLITKKRIYAVYYGYTHDLGFGITPEPHGMGVVYSEDNGITWHELNEGLLHKSINKIKMSKDGRIFCGGWNGVYELKNDKWKLLFSSKDGKTPFADFDFFYGDDGLLEKIYAIGFRNLYEYDVRKEDLKIYKHDGASPQSLYVDQDKNVIVGAHWVDGVLIWNLNNMKYSKFLKREAYVRSAITFENQKKILVGCYGGYLSSFIIDLVSHKVELINEGFESSPNIRSSEFYKDYLILGLGSYGIVIVDRDRNHRFLYIKDYELDLPIDEIQKIEVHEGELYIQCYGYGIWKTDNLRDFTKLNLGRKDYQDEFLALRAAGGNSFYITQDNKIFVIPSCETEKFGSFRCFDLRSGSLLYKDKSLPPISYGSGADMAVSKNDENIVGAIITTEIFSPLEIYLSKDGGRAWKLIDKTYSMPSLKIINDKLYYIKDASKICKYNINSQKIEIVTNLQYPISDFDIFKNYFIGAGIGHILIYNLNTHEDLWIEDSDVDRVCEVKSFEDKHCVIICGKKIIRLNINDD